MPRQLSWNDALWAQKPLVNRVPEIFNQSTLIQILACRMLGAKRLPGPMLTSYNCTITNSNSKMWMKIRTCSFKNVHLKMHDDVIKWKHFPRYWPFVWGIRRSPVNSPHKGQWRGALMFSLICAWINVWVNNREAGDLRRHRAHYDVTVMSEKCRPIKTQCVDPL